jgi:hypothetical protein
MGGGLAHRPMGGNCAAPLRQNRRALPTLGARTIGNPPTIGLKLAAKNGLG